MEDGTSGFLALCLPPNQKCMLGKGGAVQRACPPSLTDVFVCFFRPKALDYVVPEQEPDLITASHKCKIRFRPNPISVNKQLSSVFLLF